MSGDGQHHQKITKDGKVSPFSKSSLGEGLQAIIAGWGRKGGSVLRDYGQGGTEIGQTTRRDWKGRGRLAYDGTSAFREATEKAANATFRMGNVSIEGGEVATTGPQEDTKE